MTKIKAGKKLTLAAMQVVARDDGPITLKEFRAKLRTKGYEVSYDKTKEYWSSLFDRTQKIAAGSLESPEAKRTVVNGQRFIVTVAQNNTFVHDKLWKSLLLMAQVRDAKILVCRTSYNRAAWEASASKTTRDMEDVWYDPCLVDYLHTGSAKLANNLILCGELDIIPTAKQPLSGLANYTGHNSGIVPHTKQVMESYPRVGDDDPRFMYTTGTVTQRNYIDRRAGQIAAYHHVFGALYVEVDEAGEWFVRQLNADADGTLYDLCDVFYSNGTHSSTGVTGIGVTFGDIHAGSLTADGIRVIKDVLQTINPERVYLHDLIDFDACNPHSSNVPTYETYSRLYKKDTVEGNINKGGDFLGALAKEYPSTSFHVVPSNHDEFLRRWLENIDAFKDWQNRKLWLILNTMLHDRVEAGQIDFNIFKMAVELALPKGLKNVEFLEKDRSHVWRGIEHSLHGHLGPNGARGNPRSLKAVGLRVNMGHTHSSGIWDGLFCAGVMAALRMGYNKGPSSWSCSFIFTYPNEKRTIITARGSKWHA